MKKKLIYSAMFAAALAFAMPVSAQDAAYEEDCSQGLLINPNRDNWFITARGGANFLFGNDNSKAPKRDRIGSLASLYVGKWITPTFGLRFGAAMTEGKGATTANGTYRDMAHGGFSNGYYPKKYYGWAVEVDGLVNMTNWIMGYRPDRVYNAVVHGGVASMWALRHSDKNGKISWGHDRDRVFYINAGLQNNFNIGKGFDVFVDIEGQIIDWPEAEYLVNLSAGITYNFPQRKWKCPTVPACPTPKYSDAEGDALAAQLTAAENRINDLQSQLDQRRPSTSSSTNYYADCKGVTTIYYPINQSSLSNREKSILNAIAQVMKSDTSKSYQLTGWADNYTGSQEYNQTLRHNRVNGVYNYLVKCGVSPDQLKTDIDNTDLTSFGPGSASLDRAVTIREIK